MRTPVRRGAIGGAATAVLVVALGTAGCSLGATGCTDVGALEGIGLSLAEAVFVRTGSVGFRVCDDAGCRSRIQPLGRLRTPVGRGAEVTFEQLGRDFAPGTVKVRVELRGPDGSLVAAREQSVELTRSYPNGEECDGDGFVGGALELTDADRV